MPSTNSTLSFSFLSLPKLPIFKQSQTTSDEKKLEIMATEREVREGLLSESSSEVDLAQYHKGRMSSLRRLMPQKTSSAALLVVGSIFSVLGVFFALLLVTGGMDFTGYMTPGIAPMRLPEMANTTWDGWENLEYLISFGDSYTGAGFDPHGDQPSASNPFGNPPQVMDVHTTTYWAYWLTTKYNASFVRNYNYGEGGATLDPRLATSYGNNVENSLVNQIMNKYLPQYLTSPSEAVWQGRNTLHTFFFGINDIIVRSMKEPNTRHDNAKFLESYMHSVDQVYQSGARTFLFMYVPPVHMISHASNTLKAEDGQDFRDWNSQIVSQIAPMMEAKYPDVTVFTFDTYSLYSAVIQDPTVMPETAGLKEVISPCEFYGGELNATAFNPDCKYPVYEHMWINGLHPTYVIMQATAARVVSDCFGPRRKGFCS